MLQRQATQHGPVVPEAGRVAPAARIDFCRGPEHQLLEAVRRAAKSPHGRMALVLHLSRLPPPGPRPHHQRIARTLLDETAQRHEGQVFTLGNGDLVLLCRLARPGREPDPGPLPGLASPDPAVLPATLARLLRVDLPDPARVTTVWRLQEALPALTAYAAGCLAESAPAVAFPPPPGPGLAGQTGVVEAIAAIAEGPAGAGLLQRQAGVLVAGGPGTGGPGMGGPGTGGPGPAESKLRPLYAEVTFSIAALEARLAAAGQAQADPYLFRHLAARLDRRMLALLADAAGSGGPLDVAAGAGGPPLHINLTLSGLLSEPFARFAARCRGLGAAVGIEVPWAEACGDAAGFARARGLLADAGLTLVLDGVSYLALVLARPGALRADLLKLDWTAGLAELPVEERLHVAASLERIGPERIVLHRADTEVALVWGMGQGIRRFQGSYVDAILAAWRTLACPRGAGCTLRQCVAQAAVADPAGRAGCATAALLDRAAAP